MLRRTVIAACALLCLVLVLAALWAAFDWPPPRLILKYGFPPTGGPTGRTMTIEGVEFVELKPGYFRMGSHFLCEKGDLLGRIGALVRLPCGKQPKHRGFECPLRWVEVPGCLWFARTELTNEQWRRFRVGHDGAASKNDSGPVTAVSWHEAKDFCAWLARDCGFLIRLPTDPEWEWACRAGSPALFTCGDDLSELSSYASFGHQDILDVGSVARLRPNAWGLFDMHGSVDEWCDYADGVLGTTPSAGRFEELRSDSERPVRGGSIVDKPESCRCSVRSLLPKDIRGAFLGFRPLLVRRK